MKKKKLYLIIVVALLIIHIPLNNFAHQGRTDSNGGHYDRSTGEYHYHHGYKAHQHIDGKCPCIIVYLYVHDVYPDYKRQKETSNKSQNIYFFIAFDNICSVRRLFFLFHPIGS